MPNATFNDLRSHTLRLNTALAVFPKCGIVYPMSKPLLAWSLALNVVLGAFFFYTYILPDIPFPTLSFSPDTATTDTPLHECSLAALNFEQRIGVAHQRAPWVTVQAHWNNTYHKCIIELTSLAEGRKNIQLVDAFQYHVFATFAADLIKSTQSIYECGLAPDFEQLGTQQYPVDLYTASELLASTTPVACTSEKQFESYVARLMRE
jgi:hypothetical protein